VYGWKGVTEYPLISLRGSTEIQTLRITKHFFAVCSGSFLYKGYIDMVRGHETSNSAHTHVIVLSGTEK